ncbi:hypothetical protein [Listeria costaricensis]|uniref:hypothetical protein n=1 Tax=Listeria costaricensis TaxID=2026604 RepID=UPI000C0732A7|nr:hypothetical protein [Listeria costaricensis]
MQVIVRNQAELEASCHSDKMASFDKIIQSLKEAVPEILELKEGFFRLQGKAVNKVSLCVVFEILQVGQGSIHLQYLYTSIEFE